MPSYVPPQPESGGHSPHLAHHQHPNGPSPRGPSSLTSSLSCPHMLYGHQKHHSQAGPTGVANGLSAASRSSSSLLTSPTRPPAGTSTLRSQSQTNQYSGNSSSGLSSPVSRSRSGSRGRVKESGNSQLWRSQTSATGGVAAPLMSPTKPDSYGEERSSSSRSYRTVSPSTTERGPSRSASNTPGVTPQPPSYLQSTVLAPSGPGPQRERERRERDKSETRSHYTRPPTHDRTGSKTTPRQTEDRPGRSTRRPSLSGSSGGGQGGGSRSASNGSAPPRSRSATPVTRGGGHSTSQSPYPTNPTTEARGEGEKAAAVRCELSDQWMSGIEEITQHHEEQLRVERETWKNYAATMITALQAQYQQAASNSFASESAKSDEISRKLRKRVEEVEAALSTERRRHERLKGTSRDLETALEQEKGSNSRLRERQAQLEGRLKALEVQLHEASMKPKIERAPPLEEDPQPSNFSTSTPVQPTSPGNVPRHHSHKIEGMRPDSTEPRQEEGQDATNTQAPGATLGQPWTPRAFQYMLNTNGEGEAPAVDTSEPSPSSSHRPPLPLPPSRSQTYYSANTAASSSSPQTCPQAAVWSVGKGWQTLDQAPPRTAEYQTIDLSVNPISASRSRSPATADDSSRSERRERELNRSISATGGWGYGSSSTTTTIDLTSGASGASTDRSHVRTHSAPRSRSRERAETARESQPLTNLLHKFKSGMKRALSQERISGSSNGSRGRSRSSIGIEDITSSQPQLHSSNHFSPRRAPGGEAAVFNAVNSSSAFTATTHASPDQYSASPGHHF